MFEYQSEQATRRHYNFESPIFSLSADYCLDYLDFEDDFECNCNQHEIDMFFESILDTDLNYEDDFWFAEYCLGTNFLPSEMEENYDQEDDDYAEREMQDELISSCSYLNQFYSSTVHLYNDLFIHSVDSRVGF